MASGLEQLADAINQCRRRQGCGHPPCGKHAVGKPTHQAAVARPILVIGEAPAADGWWLLVAETANQNRGMLCAHAA